MREDSRWRVTRPCDLNSSAGRMPEKRHLRQLFDCFTPPHSRCDRDTKTPRISGTWSDECMARSCEGWFDLPAPAPGGLVGCLTFTTAKRRDASFWTERARTLRILTPMCRM